MRRLPLYEDIISSPLQEVEPVDIDDTAPCVKCKRGAGKALRANCMRPYALASSAEAVRLLVLFDSPLAEQKKDDAIVGGEGASFVRKLLKEHWQDDAVLDFALRCYSASPGTPKEVEACRPYLASTLNSLPNVDRVLCLGINAAEAAFGTRISGILTRRGAAWVEHNGRRIRVFFLAPPTSPARNRFIGKQFEEDFKWALTAEPELPPMGSAWFIQTAKDAAFAIKQARSAPHGTLDVETAGVMFTPSFRLLSVSITPGGSDTGYYWDRKALSDPAMTALLTSWLADPDMPKVGSNIKYDIAACFDARGWVVRGVAHDVRFAQKLLDPESEANLAMMAAKVGMGGMKNEAHDARMNALATVRKHLMKEKRDQKKGQVSSLSLLSNFVEFDPWPELEEVIRTSMTEKTSGKSKDGKWSFAFIPPDTLGRYNVMDTISTDRLAIQQAAAIAQSPALTQVWEKIVVPCAESVAQLEIWGTPCDKRAVETLRHYLVTLETQAHGALNGYKAINWSSSEQVAEYLYGDLNLHLRLPAKILKDARGKKGLVSTDADTLGYLREGTGDQSVWYHPSVPKLLELRKLEKLRGTYADGLYRHIRPDGRIHPSINIDGARTGRWSVMEPNLQTLPRPEDPLSAKIRCLFAARPGWKIVSLDYSQLELRIAASMACDEVMAQVFIEGGPGGDFHLQTAKMIAPLFNVSPDDVHKKHYLRSYAKTINFGVIYGKTARSMAEELGISLAEGQRVLDSILGRFHKLAAWLKARVREVRETGMVWTQWDGQPGRFRPLFGAGSKDGGQVRHCENAAQNTPIQGTASEYCAISVDLSVKMLRSLNLRAMLCLPVHDALIFEAPNEEVHTVVREARSIMESHYMGAGVPLVVDADVGQSWGSLEPYEKWSEA